jgi:carboxyl-terminal processing protease
MKKTDSGRVVYGGDGITPDEMYELPKASRLQAQLDGRLIFFYYAPEYFAVHDSKLMSKEWQPDANTMLDFRTFATKRGVQFTDEEFEHDTPWIRERLREELLITALSKEESDRVVFQNDPEVLKAIDSLQQSKALLDKARAVVARQGKKSAVSGEALTGSVKPRD